ncbi:MAG: xylulokinase [Chloroflexi bacterium AL-W]|nr:xylulokinase [Chloroflexi bacterium AL-N1]NOK71212.1 xylulokinase [Chloroflexi bacterium AL-N10]NOK76501.1 xylulokinase [Chloroflexi bacterium AL-N5]NOK83618.1 xylulokinase [Chloroflexi bacterium AL-W]NOK92260.1 xylulokinase [Chloroflexi bacterium AL-N15]
MTYLLGADIGTSSCKVVLINTRGDTIATSRIAYQTNYPHTNWAEQNPEEWYDHFCQAVRQCIQSAHVATASIHAVSVCGPAHDVVLLDRHGRALQSVILWSDRRSTPQAQWLENLYGDVIFDTSYQPVSPHWTLAQLLWIKERQPEIWQQMTRLMIRKDYICYRLTGSWATDWYDAIGTQLFDVQQGRWSQALCDLIDLPMSYLPPVRDATAISGRVTQQASEDTGLAVGTCVAVGSGDSVVEALGAGVFEPGQGIVKLSTSGSVSVVTATPRPSHKTITYHHLIPDRWYSIAATNSGAAAAQWFVDVFGRVPMSGNLDQIAAKAEPGNLGLIFHPYLQGERAPHWDPYLRSDFVGITIQHQQQHFARAVLEGVAFSLRDCLELCYSLDLDIHEFYVLGGGARSPLWRQIIADIFGHTLIETPTVNLAAYGAALLAGVAHRTFASFEEAVLMGKQQQTVTEPNPKTIPLYADLYVLYQRLTKSLAPIYHDLSLLMAEEATDAIVETS